VLKSEYKSSLSKTLLVGKVTNLIIKKKSNIVYKRVATLILLEKIKELS
jgi:hypothetical protein